MIDSIRLSTGTHQLHARGCCVILAVDTASNCWATAGCGAKTLCSTNYERNRSPEKTQPIPLRSSAILPT